jgi:AbrB family looped-hinge helix DNA binding protein
MRSPTRELFGVKVTVKCQVVIPKAIRKAYHLDEGSEIMLFPWRRAF